MNAAEVNWGTFFVLNLCFIFLIAVKIDSEFEFFNIYAVVSAGYLSTQLFLLDDLSILQKKTSLAVVSSPPIAVPTSELTSAGRGQGHHSKSAGAAVPSPSVSELPTYIDGLEVAQEGTLL